MAHGFNGFASPKKLINTDLFIFFIKNLRAFVLCEANPFHPCANFRQL
ncbi:hypothetical protein [Flavobacterium johnsoniae]|nr:hypothetical protein [Flavobacterium johnsoniae]WQG83122.1 hypothetical protein SR927_08375 [Flavobacterium johnsoniae UW101]SHL90901.1 hypothetical protein SAMN05444146_4924 [Flavobacterium johnsoniae]